LELCSFTVHPSVFTEVEQAITWYRSEWFRQIVWVVLGISLIFVFTFIDHKIFQELAILIYGLFIFFLIITLLFGQVRNGARSWFGIWEFGVQPSEFAKLALVFFLSKYYADNQGRIKEFQTFAIGFFVITLPPFFFSHSPTRSRFFYDILSDLFCHILYGRYPRPIPAFFSLLLD
jgi:cell division protein FtsW (lipid II flippase)